MPDLRVSEKSNSVTDEFVSVWSRHSRKEGREGNPNHTLGVPYEPGFADSSKFAKHRLVLSVDKMFQLTSCRAVPRALLSARCMFLHFAYPCFFLLIIPQLHSLPPIGTRCRSTPQYSCQVGREVFLQEKIPSYILPVAKRGYAEQFSRNKPHMNIGTIGLFIPNGVIPAP